MLMLMRRRGRYRICGGNGVTTMDGLVAAVDVRNIRASALRHGRERRGGEEEEEEEDA